MNLRAVPMLNLAPPIGEMSVLRGVNQEKTRQSVTWQVACVKERPSATAIACSSTHSLRVAWVCPISSRLDDVARGCRSSWGG